MIILDREMSDNSGPNMAASAIIRNDVLRMARGNARRALLALPLLAVSPVAAQEACGEATVGSCFPQYDSIAAVATTSSGFAAVGLHKTGLDLLSLGPDGERTGSRQLALPDWLAEEGAERVEVQKLVAGSDEELLIVANVAIGPSDRRTQAGVFGLVDSAGAVDWSGPMRFSNQTSTILYSGVHDPAEDRFLLVGRHTNGADSGRCTSWSQGLIISASRSGLQVNLSGAASPGTHNRTAFYDIASVGDGAFAVTGFATARGNAAGTCQDNAVVMQISGGIDGEWSAGNRVSFGDSGVNEVAFAIAAAGDGRVILAGQGGVPDGGARAAMLATLPLDGGKPEVEFLPFPEDASDKAGGDRYRAIARLPGEDGFVVAGSASSSREARNQAMWQHITEPGDRSAVSFLTETRGSDILGLAADEGGTVLAVGTHGDGGRANVGWLGIIYGGGPVMSAERREPDTSLPEITAAEAAAGGLALSERELNAGIGLRGANLKAGSVFDVNFSVSADVSLTARGLPAQGDFDMALFDGAGRLVGYSSNLDDAGEYAAFRLQAGAHTLRLVAVTDVPTYEIRLGVGEPIDADVAIELETLDATARKVLTDQLADAGYGAAANPNIALGPQTVRSLIAYYGTFHAEVDSGSVAGFAADTAAAEVQ